MSRKLTQPKDDQGELKEYEPEDNAKEGVGRLIDIYSVAFLIGVDYEPDGKPKEQDHHDKYRNEEIPAFLEL